MKKVYMLEAAKIQNDRDAYMALCVAGVEDYSNCILRALSPIAVPDILLILAAVKAAERALAAQHPKAAALADELVAETDITTIALRFPKMYGSDESE